MMDIQLMRCIVDPVEAGRTPRVVQDAAARWHGEALTYFRSSANHIFRFSQDGQGRFLRLSNAADHTRESIQTELDFICHVSGQGVPSAGPVPSDDGSLIETLTTDGLAYHAVAFEALQGGQFEADDLDEQMARAWGRSLATLHQASQSFRVQPARSHWLDDIRSLLSGLTPAEHAVAEALEAGHAWLQTLPEQPHGLIHGDFELDNLVWDGEQFQVLDFDDAVYSWHAADIAIAVQDIQSDAARLDWFFEGYASVIPVPDGARDALPRWANLLLAIKIARLMRAYATTTGDDQPGWLIEMRDRHQDWLAARKAMLK